MTEEHEPRRESVGADLARHILSSSGTMIGICTTLVGLVKILEGQKGLTSTDEYGAVVAVGFLGSAISSYMSLRMTARPAVARFVGRMADVLFLIALTTLVLLLLFFAFELI